MLLRKVAFENAVGFGCLINQGFVRKVVHCGLVELKGLFCGRWLTSRQMAVGELKQK